MSDRQKLLNEIIAAVYAHPELRLCQILSIAAHKSGYNNDDLFYIEDSQLTEGLKEFNG